MIDLEQEVQIRRQRLEELKKTVEEIRKIERELQKLEDALAVLRGNESVAESESLSKRPGMKGAPSTVQLVKTVLSEAGKPLNSNEILEKIQAMGYQIRKESLVSTLSRNCKSDHPIFKRPGRSLYALANGNTQAHASPLIPSNFLPGKGR